LVVDAEFETGRAPFDEVEGGLGFEGGDGCVAVTWDDVATVEECDGHVFSIAGIADDLYLLTRISISYKEAEYYHLVVGLKASIAN
jgi:hypothetical protein